MTNRSVDVATLREQVETLKVQLAEAQKMTALGELIGTTTHEFNNVLMTVINYAKMGIRTKDEATRDKALEKILLAGQRAAKITNTILGVARNRSNSREPTNLAALIDEALVLLEREMNKYRIAVEVDLQRVPAALVNGNQIQQVLFNLLTNARQAMDNGGRILIQLRDRPEEKMVILTVRDSGCGIAPDRLPRIFDPFFTTKQGPDASGKGGTGLGLCSCREIVESHQGRIRVESTLGKGTAFTIKLPTVPAREPSDRGDAVSPGVTLSQPTTA